MTVSKYNMTPGVQARVMPDVRRALDPNNSLLHKITTQPFNFMRARYYTLMFGFEPFIYTHAPLEDYNVADEIGFIEGP